MTLAGEIDVDFIERDAKEEPRGNLRHIGDDGLNIDDVEDVLHDPTSRPVQSPGSRRPVLIGRTSTGKTIIMIDERFKRPDTSSSVLSPPMRLRTAPRAGFQPARKNVGAGDWHTPS